MDWALEKAPPMPAQLVATLTGLARHADKKGRGSYPSVARLAAYTCKAERSVQRDLKQLRDLGFIRLGDQSKAGHLPEGKRPEVYDLALHRIVPGGRAGSDEVTRASRVTLASSRRRGGKKKPSSDEYSDPGTGDVHVTPDVDVTRDVDVAAGVPSTSQEGRRGRHPNQKTEPRAEPKTSSTAAASSRELSDEEIKEFGNFWLLHPKSKNQSSTRELWTAAIDQGAAPEQITAAAVSYAKEVAGNEWRFIKQSDNWLRDRRYEDKFAPEPTGKPDLRSVGGTKHQPYTPPVDHSVYENGFRHHVRPQASGE
jgi:hypothetical protein